MSKREIRRTAIEQYGYLHGYLNVQRRILNKARRETTSEDYHGAAVILSRALWVQLLEIACARVRNGYVISPRIFELDLSPDGVWLEDGKGEQACKPPDLSELFLS